MNAREFATATATADTSDWDWFTWNTWNAAQAAVAAHDMAGMVFEDVEWARSEGRDDVATFEEKHGQAVAEAEEEEANFRAHFDAEADAGMPGSQCRQNAAANEEAESFRTWTD
jgi:hypothetical protein